MNYKVTDSEILHYGKVFDLKVDTLIYDSGNKGIREIAVHKGGAVVVPITNEGKIVFVKQFRYPLQKFLLELPAGKLEENEDPYVCAERELTEETGYISTNIKPLGKIYTTPGFCTELLHIYLATSLTMHNYDREEGEFGMTVLELHPKEVVRRIMFGDIVDAKTICGIFYYLNRENT
ncbi:MAG TPA: NUDIX hydrolase [Melioribacteraceae bacterium]|nr:NUDIX hydrolase [Melioribacteraceae bacterium]